MERILKAQHLLARSKSSDSINITHRPSSPNFLRSAVLKTAAAQVFYNTPQSVSA